MNKGAMTWIQKEWRKAARMCTADALTCVKRATDPYRDIFLGQTREEWAKDAIKWAKQAAHSAFQAHPELRSL